MKNEINRFPDYYNVYGHFAFYFIIELGNVTDEQTTKNTFDVQHTEMANYNNTSTLNLDKNLINKRAYSNVIDTSFSQLLPPPPPVEDTITVNEFFDYYLQLFYDIPEKGENNSHEFLITRRRPGRCGRSLRGVAKVILFAFPNPPCRSA